VAQHLQVQQQNFLHLVLKEMTFETGMLYYCNIKNHCRYTFFQNTFCSQSNDACLNGCPMI
jgi:hypothetical protein